MLRGRRHAMRRGCIGGQVQEQEGRDKHGYGSEEAAGQPASQEQGHVIVYHLDYHMCCVVQIYARLLGPVILLALSLCQKSSVPGGCLDQFY